jgi:hypothetical protein
VFSNEPSLFNWLKNNIQGDWIRIENVAGTGVPDVNYAIRGVEGWTELKVIRRKTWDPLKPVQVCLRKEQFAWLMRRGRHGIVSVTVGFTTGEILIVPFKRIPALWAGASIPQELSPFLYRANKASVGLITNAYTHKGPFYDGYFS